ncbi:MAG: hypothetical protein QXK89_06610 [Candidatus Bathyarchaeia archaeon]|nr:hypothetical protein [Candidatus Bathyarchaeota archaeon]
MSEEKKIENVRDEMGLLERLVSYIPGYRGYKEKEIRRESDRLVRMEAANRLKAAKNVLRRRLANPSLIQSFSGEDSWMVDTLISRLDRVIQRIDRAVAGYAGMFDSIRVREDKLDAVIQHDLSLIEKADSLKARVEVLVKMKPGGDEWRKEMEDLIARVEEIDALIDKRTEIFRGLVG